MIDHNVVRFHISVHDALAVTEIKCLEELENIVSDIEVVELGVEAAEVGIVDIFKDQRRCLALHGICIRNGFQVLSPRGYIALGVGRAQFEAGTNRGRYSHL